MTRLSRGKRHIGCDEAGRQISAYLDDELGPGEASELRAHLDACPACRSELAGIRTTREVLRALPQVRAPRAFFVAAPEQTRPRFNWFPALIRATVAAVALFASTAGVASYLDRESGTLASSTKSSASEVALLESPGGSQPTATAVTGANALASAPKNASDPSGVAETRDAPAPTRSAPTPAAPVVAAPAAASGAPAQAAAAKKDGESAALGAQADTASVPAPPPAARPAISATQPVPTSVPASSPAPTGSIESGRPPAGAVAERPAEDRSAPPAGRATTGQPPSPTSTGETSTLVRYASIGFGVLAVVLAAASLVVYVRERRDEPGGISR